MTIVFLLFSQIQYVLFDKSIRSLCLYIAGAECVLLNAMESTARLEIVQKGITIMVILNDYADMRISLSIHLVLTC